MIYVENAGDGDHLELRFGGRHWDKLHAILKSQSNSTFVGKDKTKRPHWLIPFNVLEDVQDDLTKLESTVGPIGMVMSINAAAANDQWKATIDRRYKLQRELDIPVNLGKYFHPPKGFPMYQQVGARFLYASRRAIIGDPTGYGKTCQAIAATTMGILANRFSKVILICEPQLRKKMVGEVQKFVDWRPYLADGNRTRRARTYKEFARDPDPAFLVLAYTTCRLGLEWIPYRTDDGKVRRRFDSTRAEVRSLLKELGGKPYAVLVDEVQNCKHWQSLQTRGVNLIAEPADHIYGLSATYCEGRLEEAHTVIRVCRPTVFGPLYNFTRRHVNEHAYGEANRYKLVGEVKRKLRPFVVRRREGEVDDEGVLPKTIFLDRRLIMNKNQQALYRKVLDEEQAKREEAIAKRGGDKSTDGLWRMNRERLACLFPELIDPTVTESPKFDDLLNIIQDQEPDAKFVVFSWFQDVVELLIQRLDVHWRTIGIHGGMGMNDNAREALKLEFQTNPDVKILVTSDVWRKGQDLDAAHHLVNFDVLWEPGGMDQRAGRIRRMTSRFKQVVVHTQIIEHTVEAYQLDHVVAPKRKVMDEIMDDSQAMPGVEHKTIRDIVRQYRG